MIATVHAQLVEKTIAVLVMTVEAIAAVHVQIAVLVKTVETTAV